MITLRPLAPEDRAQPASLVEAFVRDLPELPRRSAFARLFGVETLSASALSALAGAVAEADLVDALRHLGPDWTIVEEPSIEPRSIAAVLIGPPGVFTVTLRNHYGQDVWVGERTVVVAGERHSHIADAEAAAERVAEQLSARLDEEVAVTPCLAVAEPAALDLHPGIRRLLVLDAKRVAGRLAELPRLLSPDAVARIGSVARCAFDSPSTDSSTIARVSSRERFDAMRTVIATARRRRLLWSILGTALTLGSLVTVLAPLFR